MYHRNSRISNRQLRLIKWELVSSEVKGRMGESSSFEQAIAQQSPQGFYSVAPGDLFASA